MTTNYSKDLMNFVEENMDLLELLYSKYVLTFTTDISFELFCEFAFNNQ